MSIIRCRLKKVQGKKKRDAALEEEKRRKAAETAEPLPIDESDANGPGDLLSHRDEDVIF